MQERIHAGTAGTLASPPRGAATDPSRAGDRVGPWPTLVLGVAGLALLSLLLRPLLPVDETRYLAVAWEMWQRGDFLLPTLNGALYEHKPPLLFWLVHLGWSITGVNEAWPRMIGPLAMLASLWLLSRLARRLYPDRPRTQALSAQMLLGTGFIAVLATTLMFDLLLLACLLAAWNAQHDAIRRGWWRDWSGVGLATAAALLAKGPVAFVYLLPTLLAWRAWAPPGAAPVQPRRLLAALALALALPLAWLLAADHASGGELVRRVVMEQTLGRVQGELGHPRPAYWYLPWLPLVLFPWSFWPPAWRALRARLRARPDRAGRFLAIAIGVPFLVLSAVGGKQVHYLVPLVALCTIALAAGSTTAGGASPAGARRLAAAGFALVLLAMVAVYPALAPRYDLEAAGRYVGEQQRAGRTVAYVGKYQGEFGYHGRLRAPLVELRPEEAGDWARAHPEALVVSRRKRVHVPASLVPEFRQRYKSDELLMLGAGDLVRHGGAFRNPAARRR